MSYWSGTFNFEYNSFDMDDYLECTHGKDIYVIDFGVECTAYAEGREDSGSWDEPPSADIDEVTLEDMEFYYCVAYKKTDDIDDIFDIVGEEELGYVIVNKSTVYKPNNSKLTAVVLRDCMVGVKPKSIHRCADAYLYNVSKEIPSWLGEKQLTDNLVKLIKNI